MTDADIIQRVATWRTIIAGKTDTWRRIAGPERLERMKGNLDLAEENAKEDLSYAVSLIEMVSDDVGEINDRLSDLASDPFD